MPRLSRIFFDDMYVFTKVAESRSITLASEKLGMSKQTVSRKISKLEETLNILLIARTTRSFELTAAGLEYYKQCADLFGEVEKVNDVITAFQSTPSGTVKLGVQEIFPSCEFSDMITKYLAQNENINIQISHNFKESDLINKNIDIAFRVGNLNDSSMIARKIGKIKFVHVASVEYLKTHGIPKSSSDLRNHKIIEIENSPYYGGQCYKQKITAKNYYISKEFAVSGFGIAIVPLKMALNDVKQERLSVLNDDHFSIEEDVNIVYLGSRHLPRQVRDLIDYIVSCRTQSVSSTPS